MKKAPFPSITPLIDQRLDAKAYALHRQKVASAQAVVDTTAPQYMHHLDRNRKKEEQDAERQFEIDAENARLFQKLAKIEDFDSTKVLRASTSRQTLLDTPGIFHSGNNHCVDHINLTSSSNPQSIRYRGANNSGTASPLRGSTVVSRAASPLTLSRAGSRQPSPRMSTNGPAHQQQPMSMSASMSTAALLKASNSSLLDAIARGDVTATNGGSAAGSATASPRPPSGATTSRGPSPGRFSRISLDSSLQAAAAQQHPGRAASPFYRDGGGVAAAGAGTVASVYGTPQRSARATPSRSNSPAGMPVVSQSADSVLPMMGSGHGAGLPPKHPMHAGGLGTPAGSPSPARRSTSALRASPQPAGGPDNGSADGSPSALSGSPSGFSNGSPSGSPAPGSGGQPVSQRFLSPSRFARSSLEMRSSWSGAAYQQPAAPQAAAGLDAGLPLAPHPPPLLPSSTAPLRASSASTRGPRSTTALYTSTASDSRFDHEVRKATLMEVYLGQANVVAQPGGPISAVRRSSSAARSSRTSVASAAGGVAYQPEAPATMWLSSAAALPLHAAPGASSGNAASQWQQPVPVPPRGESSGTFSRGSINSAGRQAAGTPLSARSASSSGGAPRYPEDADVDGEVEVE